MPKRKFYKLINSSGYVLSNQYEKSAEIVLGYGGVWTKDHRKAKRFNSQQEVQREVNRMRCGRNQKFLMVGSDENWKSAYKKNKDKLR